ncbi:class I SAM-dependent methyltransferase [Thiolapillus sp.]
MKWGISYTFSCLPYGRPLYEKILRRFGELSQVSSSTRFRNAEVLLKMGRRWCGGVDGQHVVELGTGWVSAVPLGFGLAGARVDTFDISYLVADDLFRQTRDVYRNRSEQLARASGTAPEKIRQRLKKIELAHNFSEACQLLGGSYHAPFDTTALPFKDGEVDMVISNLVLQCVPKDAIPLLLQESWRILKPGGVALHRIRMSDEYSPPGSGRNHLEYLKYSERIWNRWFNHSLKHINRLRAPQFLELFRQHGFGCLECIRKVDYESIPHLQQLTLAPSFRHMSWEDIATTNINVALRKIPVSEKQHSTTNKGFSFFPLFPVDVAPIMFF